MFPSPPCPPPPPLLAMPGSFHEGGRCQYLPAASPVEKKNPSLLWLMVAKRRRVSGVTVHAATWCGASHTGSYVIFGTAPYNMLLYFKQPLPAALCYRYVPKGSVKCHYTLCRTTLYNTFPRGAPAHLPPQTDSTTVKLTQIYKDEAKIGNHFSFT